MTGVAYGSVMSTNDGDPSERKALALLLAAPVVALVTGLLVSRATLDGFLAAAGMFGGPAPEDMADAASSLGWIAGGVVLLVFLALSWVARRD
jgi:hypothetical protein